MPVVPLTSSPAVELSRQEGRRERTRQSLIAAGEKLFADDYDGVSIDDLVAAAGVAKGTFYNHFADKLALFQAIVTNVRDDLRGTILEEVGDIDEPARKCVRGFCLAVRYIIRRPARRKFLLASQQEALTHLDETDVGIAAHIAEGIASGRFRVATVEAGVLHNFGLVQICAALDFGTSGGFAATARVQQLGAILLRGLGVAHEEAEALAAQEADRAIRPLYLASGVSR